MQNQIPQPTSVSLKFVAKVCVTIVMLAGSAMTSVDAWAQQDYPSRPVRLVVPYPAGAGVLDLTTRMVATGLSELWGQQVIVDNKPGANEIIAIDNVAHSPADGYSLIILTDSGLLYNEYLYKKLPYDIGKDLVPVSRIGMGRMVLVVGNSVPVNTMAELIAYAKQNPGKLNYGSAGVGGSTHLPMEWFKQQQALDIKHVPYKGTAAAVQDVLAGNVQLTLAAASVVAQHVKAGTLKAISVSGPKRLANLPNTPTFAEAGYPAMSADYMIAMATPAKTPPALVEKLASDLAKVVNSRAFQERVIGPSAMETAVESPAQFASYLRNERPMAADKVKSSGASLD